MTEEDRIDHHNYVPETWVGLLSTALFMMQLGPNISTLSDPVEDWLALGLFLGSGLCLIGALLGTKWFFPSANRRTSYLFELVGLPFVIVVLGWYTYASVDPNNLFLSGLSGGLGLTLEIASLRMIVNLIQQVNGDD